MGASRVGGCEARGSTQYIPHKKYELFYSEHTVYFPDPLCCARSMVELCSIQKALHKGELFGVAYFLVTSGLHMLRGMLLRAGRRRMYS